MNKTFSQITVGAFLSTALSTVALTAPHLVQVSSDPYTNATSQHQTQVEPDNFSFDQTTVSAFQVGRFNDGGSSNIGWATTTDGGKSWTHGFLPGLTKFEGNGPYDRVSDPVVAYDLKHNVWMISHLPIMEGSSQPVSVGVMVSLSTDGTHWGDPIMIAKQPSPSSFYDKNWTACDNNASSPYFGHCYTEWDDATKMQVLMSTSVDGGKTWGAPINPPGFTKGIGGQPVIQPNGTVVVPYADASPLFGSTFKSFRSTNGGATWSSPVKISKFGGGANLFKGKFRAPEELMSVDVDPDGVIYGVWSDCRFEKNCKSNDIVFTTSTDGLTWSTPARIPIAVKDSGKHFFIPGLAVDSQSRSGKARVGLTYFFTNDPNCSQGPCELGVGFVSSPDGGKSWGDAVTLTSGMNIAWLPGTSQGTMIGDYLSTAFMNGLAYPVFAVANPNHGNELDVAMNSIAEGLSVVNVGLHPLELPGRSESAQGGRTIMKADSHGRILSY